MPKPVKHITTITKALLEERLLEFNTTSKRKSWEDIKNNARQGRIEKGIEEADNGDLKPWKEVKVKLIKKIKQASK